MNAAPPHAYLDHNATTPVDPAVAAEMLPWILERFGNAASVHAWGIEARKAIDAARVRVAEMLGARPEEIVFSSGGSESNNTVVKGVASLPGSKGRHIIVSSVEHPCILEPCASLEAQGFRVTRLPVDALGRVDPGDVERAIARETILISVMHANNEVGTIQPIEAIAAIARSRGVPFHTDAAQSIGKIPVNVDDLGADFLSLAGHKFNAPQGVGALYVRSGHTVPALIQGAGHQQGRRSGTENVAGIVGLGRACSLVTERLDTTGFHLRAMRDRLWSGLARSFPGLRRNGDPEGGLPNTLSVSFRGIPASTLLQEIGDRVAASAGAACHADGVRLSTTMKAMNVPVEDAMGTVRFSSGRTTTPAEIDAAIDVVTAAVRRMHG